jgi:hypothetical protein
MTTQVPVQLDKDDLAEEAGRYLIAVEAFRVAGCEPLWLPEVKGGQQDE